MHPSSEMVRAACAAGCLSLMSLLPAQAAGAPGGFRGAAPARAFPMAPRVIVQPQVRQPAPAPNTRSPGFHQPGYRNFGYRGAGPLYGHVRTAAPPYPPQGIFQRGPGIGHNGQYRSRLYGGGAYVYPYGAQVYPYGAYGVGTYGAPQFASQVEPPLTYQYAEPPVQGYYGYRGYYGGPAPCVAPVIIQIGASAPGRLLPSVAGGGGAGCSVPQVVTYSRADAGPRVIEGVGRGEAERPRRGAKRALRVRY